MDSRLDELKKYQIAIGARVIIIEIMQTPEEAIKWFHAIDVLDLTADTLLR